jgi:hypothetical protein
VTHGLGYVHPPGRYPARPRKYICTIAM